MSLKEFSDYLRHLMSKEAARKVLSLATLAIAGSIAIVAAMALTFRKDWPGQRDQIDTQVLRDIEIIRGQVQSLGKSVEENRHQLKIVTSPDSSTAAGAQLAALSDRVEALQKRLEGLEKGLLDNPEKALSVPILRKDLEGLREQRENDIRDTAASVDRIYDQNKWFIGLMATMALGLFTLAVSNLLPAKKQEATPANKSEDP